jgi:hypothetical protein
VQLWFDQKTIMVSRAAVAIVLSHFVKKLVFGFSQHAEHIFAQQVG